MSIEPQWEEYDELGCFMAWEFSNHVSLLEFLSPALRKKVEINAIIPSVAGCDAIISFCKDATVKAETSKEVISDFAYLAIIHMRDAYEHVDKDELYSCYECLGKAQQENGKADLILNLQREEIHRKRDSEIFKNRPELLAPNVTLPHAMDAKVLAKFISEERQKKLHKAKAKIKKTKTDLIIATAKEIGWNQLPLEKMTYAVLNKLDPKGKKRGFSTKTIYRVLKDAGHSTMRTGRKK
jgi:hypothetical protein